MNEEKKVMIVGGLNAGKTATMLAVGETIAEAVGVSLEPKLPDNIFKGCMSCGKPTRSHQLGRATMCHNCWNRMTPEQHAQIKKMEMELRLEKAMNTVKFLALLSKFPESRVHLCQRHNFVESPSTGCCPDCEAEADADMQAAAAQAEYEAAAREQAEFEDQQAADEAYHNNQGGPDGY